MNRRPNPLKRRRRLTTRALPLAALALVSFIAGVSTGTGDSKEKEATARFIEAWAGQDFAAMHAELNPAAQDQYSVDALTTAYLDAQQTSTLESIDPGSAKDPSTRGDETFVTVPLRINMVAFGELDSELEIPYADGGIDWKPALVFPGLGEGETLDTDVRLGHRGRILARDGTPLAEGPPLERSSPLGDAAIDVVGEVGEAGPEEAAEFAELGYPEGTPVGISGLEQAFNAHLAGKPGGDLLAVSAGAGAPRVLASGEPEPGEALRTTIDPDLQEAAVSAIAPYSGGVAVLDARDGSVRALAGAAFSVPQPPGSTFKIITTTAALQKGLVTFEDEFPVVSTTSVGGYILHNASDELCGGTFVDAFAHSCNTVFGPLGLEVGERDLVATAQRFGWNEQPALYNDEATAIIDPSAPTIPLDPGDDVDLGVSAIGQGEVLATPLNMASVAQTIASGGVRHPTSIVKDPELGPDAEPVRVMSRKIANQITDLMVAVVEFGTAEGTGSIPEAQVAGKTGTSELGPRGGDPNADQVLDAWFTAFAPADKPRLVAAAMVIDSFGSGGDIAAPIVTQVLSEGL